MKRLLLSILACLLLSAPVLACDVINTFDGACQDGEPVQLAWMGAVGVGASGGGGCTETCGDYLICQNFEGTGYDNSESWSQLDGGADCTINPDYTTVNLRSSGSQSFAITITSSTICRVTSPTFSDASTLYGHFMFQLPDLSVAGSTIILLNGTTTLGSIETKTDGKLRVYQGSVYNDSSSSVISVDTPYHIWFKYVAEDPDTALNGQMLVWVGTTTTRPASPTNTITTGTSALAVNAIRFQTPVSTRIWDQVLLDTVEFATVSHRQIHLSAARKEDPETTLEDEYGVPISVESLARKALEPGQLEQIFDRHRNGCKPKPKEKRTAEPQNIEYPTVDIGGTVSVPALPPRPPVEIVKKGNDYVEVPYKDTRTREQKIADLHRELEEWKRSLIANFAAKIEEHAAALREMIEEQVT